MLLTMYSGDYTTANAEHVLSKMLRNALAQHDPTPSLKTEINPDTYLVCGNEGLSSHFAFTRIANPRSQTHAKMYAMGDKYQFAALMELARSKFVAAIDETDFTLDDLVAAIDVVYSTTPDSDYGLRKHVVYKAQSQMQQLKQLPSFKEIFEKYVGFGWDIATEFKARKSVWCVSCAQESKLPVACTCGFHGFCGGLKACNELDWVSLKCSRCKRGGQLVRDQPRDDDEVTIILTRETQSAPTSTSTFEPPAKRGKKRKSM